MGWRCRARLGVFTIWILRRARETGSKRDDSTSNREPAAGSLHGSGKAVWSPL